MKSDLILIHNEKLKILKISTELIGSTSSGARHQAGYFREEHCHNQGCCTSGDPNLRLPGCPPEAACQAAKEPGKQTSRKPGKFRNLPDRHSCLGNLPTFWQNLLKIDAIPWNAWILTNGQISTNNVSLKFSPVGTIIKLKNGQARVLP